MSNLYNTNYNLKFCKIKSLFLHEKMAKSCFSSSKSLLIFQCQLRTFP
ncbi:hypothetical protein [Moraxella lacunata]